MAVKEESPPVRRLGGKLFAFIALAFSALEMETHSSFFGATTAHHIDLAEGCCTKDSPLAAAVEHSGGQSKRYSVWDGFELSSKTGARRLVLALRQDKPRWVWMSPPCDPWTSCQNMNASDPARVERLRMKRLKSQRIFKNARWAISQYLQEEPDAEFCGEQPLRAQSWNAMAWSEFKRSLLECSFDGCEFDLRDEDDQLVKQSWRVMTTSRALQRALHQRRCSHGHNAHTAVTGARAAATTLYPLRMCRLIARIIMKRDNIEQGIANLFSTFTEAAKPEKDDLAGEYFDIFAELTDDQKAKVVSYIRKTRQSGASEQSMLGEDAAVVESAPRGREGGAGMEMRRLRTSAAPRASAAFINCER